MTEEGVFELLQHNNSYQRGYTALPVFILANN